MGYKGRGQARRALLNRYIPLNVLLVAANAPTIPLAVLI